MEKIDETIQIGNVLLTTAKKYATSISADAIQGLTNALDDLLAKDTAQKVAVQKVTGLTTLQNASLNNGLALIRKTQNATKVFYGEDNKAMMKEFHVGGNKIITVKAMTTELAYMKSVATTRLTDLTKGGLKDTDLTAFDTVTASLETSDAEQEAAKKEQKKATKIRDDAMETLKKAMRKARNNAKVVFADQPTVLIEFEPIPEGRSNGTLKPETTTTEQKK